MKRVLTAALILVLSLSLAYLASGAEQPIPKDVTIEYLENPTTGFEWSVSIAPEGVVQIASDLYIPDDPEGALAGAGGRREWTIQGVASGDATMTMIYSQPWDTQAEPYATVIYTLHVDEDMMVTITDMQGDAKDLTPMSVEEMEGLPQGL